MCLVGIPKHAIHIENYIQGFLFRSLTLRTIHGRKIWHTWEEAEKLIVEKKLDLSPMITRTYPLAEFEAAFAELFTGNACKIMLDPTRQ